jgi:acyl-CoA thioesterase II
MSMPAQLLVSLLERDPEEKNPDKVPIRCASGAYSAKRASRMEHQGWRAMMTTRGMLVELLDLQRIEVDIFRGRSPDENLQRVFGGQVAGQALVAAGRTVPPDRPVHSLPASFIRPGDPDLPIVSTVDRIRDGRSSTTRRVVAVQHGRAIFARSASFQVAETGPEYQAPMPEAPEPETVPSWRERLKEYGDQVPARWLRPRPVEVRYVGDPPWQAQAMADHGSHPRWYGASQRDPDPLLHVCAVTYASDLTLLDAVLLGSGLAWDEHSVTGASLDHAMWFHAPFRADDWLLYLQESPAASGARGLARGQVFSRDGRLVASVVQQGLIRVSSPKLCAKGGARTPESQR